MLDTTDINIIDNQGMSALYYLTKHKSAGYNKLAFVLDDKYINLFFERGASIKDIVNPRALIIRNEMLTKELQEMKKEWESS